MHLTRSCLPVLAAIGYALLISAGPASAFPTSRANCTNCHSTNSGNNLSVSGNLTTPTSLSVSPRLDTGSTSTLPCFTVAVGGLITLTLNGTPIGGDPVNDVYAFAITGTTIGTGTGNTLGNGTTTLVSGSQSGVKTSLSDKLIFTLGTNAGWTTQTKASGTWIGSYFTSNASIPWTAGTQSSTFTFTVNATTPLDVYSLTARIATDNLNTGTHTTQSQEFLINVVPEPATLGLLGVSGLALFLTFRRRK